MKRVTIATALISAIFAVPTITSAQQHDLEHLVVEMAKTRQEHQALAGHYKMKADEAREAAREHESLARTYASQRSAPPQGRQHCENLAKKYNELATEYDGLASVHEEMAKSAAQ